jgi:hypothetical protein
LIEKTYEQFVIHCDGSRCKTLKNDFFNLLVAQDIFHIAESWTVVIPAILQRYAKLLNMVEMQGDWQFMLGMILANELQKCRRIWKKFYG